MSSWTDELLDLMLEKLIERKKREVDTMKGRSNTVSAETLASRSHGMVEVKHGD